MSQKKTAIDEIETLFRSYLQSVRKYVTANSKDRNKLEELLPLLAKQKEAIVSAHDSTAEYSDALHHVEIQLSNLKGILLNAAAEAEPKEQTLEFEFCTH